MKSAWREPLAMLATDVGSWAVHTEAERALLARVCARIAEFDRTLTDQPSDSPATPLGAAGGDDVEARLVNVLRQHLPKDRYDDEGQEVGTFCSCGGWEGDYFADGEAGPYDDHLAAMLAPIVRAERAEGAREALEEADAIADQRDRAELDAMQAKAETAEWVSAYDRELVRRKAAEARPEAHDAASAALDHLARVLPDHMWRGGYYCQCGHELNSPRGWLEHLAAQPS